MYGTDTEATKTSFVDNFTYPSMFYDSNRTLFFFVAQIYKKFFFSGDIPEAIDCPEISQSNTEAIDKLKSMIDIRPKVVQDFNTMYEKFPCGYVKNIVSVSF